jgi:hypothetical protein
MRRIAVALLLSACSLPFRPVTPPATSQAGVEVRIDALKVGGVGTGPRDGVDREIRSASSGLTLELQTHAVPGERLTGALVTRMTRRPCSGGSPLVVARVDGASPARLPVSVGDDHALALGFLPTPEEALEGPTALDLVLEEDGQRRCARVPLGPASGWQRPQLAMEVELDGGAPLRSLGNMGTPWTLDERIGALFGRTDVSAGLRVGVATCASCDQGAAIVFGPSFASTFFPVTARPFALGIEVTYASLFELFRYPTDPSGSSPRLGDWYQVVGFALQLDGLSPPRGGRVRLRGRDFGLWGVQLFEQLWIPTLHPAVPTAVLGMGLVSRLPF